MEFEDKKLKAKELKEGLVYVVKDGRLLLYCGKVNSTEYLFYVVGSVVLLDYSIYNFEFMHPFVVNSVTKLLESQINMRGVCLYRNLPYCIGAYPQLDFQQYLKVWLARNRMFVKEFSDKVKFEEDTSPKYVKAKDLVAGLVYTSTSSYEEDYVYLGKDSMNNYCWSFIGNHQSFSNDPYRYLNYWQNIDRLKSLKKVRGVSNRYPNLRLDVSKLQGINGIM